MLWAIICKSFGIGIGLCCWGITRFSTVAMDRTVERMGRRANLSLLHVRDSFECKAGEGFSCLGKKGENVSQMICNPIERETNFRKAFRCWSKQLIERRGRSQLEFPFQLSFAIKATQENYFRFSRQKPAEA
jgi:hypothetical protein